MPEPRTARNQFYDMILNQGSEGLYRDAAAISDSWREATGAAWVWFWLRNDVARRWELLESSPRNLFAPANTITTGKSLGDFAVAAGRPLIGHTPGQIEALDGQSCSVAFPALLQEHRCCKIDIIPLVSEEPRPDRKPLYPFLDLKIVGMIALHYCDDSIRIDHAPASLMRMAAMTTQRILQALREKQLSLLVKLNGLAGEFLPQTGRPQNVRSAYLRRLINLISDETECSAVSVFFERQWSRTAFCIGTTGLRSSRTGQVLTADEAEQTSYEINQLSWTGKAIISGKPFVRLLGEPTPEHVGSYEEAPGGMPLHGQSLLFMPIPRVGSGSSDNHSKEQSASGVIRCSGHTISNSMSVAKDFDTAVIQRVAFIAWQISPVLETFGAKIVREDAVEVLRHDLKTPLNVQRNALNAVEKQPILETLPVERREYRIRHYDLKNMQNAVRSSQDLVAQLNADPFHVRPPITSKVFLDGNIIAGLANLMGHYAEVERQITITYGDFRGSPDGKIPPVRPVLVDRDLIERAFANILNNAIKYGDRGSRIKIDPLVDAEGLKIWISNFGIGIKESDRIRIFEPYIRSADAIRTAEGAGLGLGISRSIMRAHGGELKLVRDHDPTIFEFFFPRSLFL